VSGNPSEKRNRLTAMKAARMHHEGRSHKEISDATGIPADRVTTRIKLGERLLSLADVGTRPQENVGAK
jgi:hypothetical protein